MRALAHRREGKAAMARLQWEAAETVVRARLQANPTGIGEKFELCVTLAPLLAAELPGVRLAERWLTKATGWLRGRDPCGEPGDVLAGNLGGARQPALVRTRSTRRTRMTFTA